MGLGDMLQSYGMKQDSQVYDSYNENQNTANNDLNVGKTASLMAIDNCIAGYVKTLRMESDPLLESLKTDEGKERLLNAMSKKDSGDKAVLAAYIYEKALSTVSETGDGRVHNVVDLVYDLQAPSINAIRNSVHESIRPSEHLVGEILHAIPSPDVVSDNNTESLVHRLNAAIFASIESDLDKVSVECAYRLYTIFFGENNKLKIAKAILKEDRSLFFSYKSDMSQTLWNDITNLALEILEDEKDFRKVESIIYSFAMERKIDSSYENRINLIDDLCENDYPKTTRTIKTLIKRDPSVIEFLK